MSKIRTGIYGGSFNPIHNGHIAIARAMTTRAGLDEVWLVVSPQNPLKPAGSLRRTRNGCLWRRQLSAAFPASRQPTTNFICRDPHTCGTLQSLSRDFPERDFTLLARADNWAVFHRWFRADDIIAHYPIAIYPRTGYPIDTASLPPNVKLIDTGLYDISSTQVRELIARGGDITGLMPDSVVPLATQFYSK